jgi:predicted nuclease of predicted toxin-antitoxin system
LRFLVDANLSPRVVARLLLEGHDVVHVGDVGLLTADDETILAHASREERAIVSADADFATLLAVANRSEPSLVLLRSADLLTPVQQAELILANLEAVETDLRAGAVVTIGRGHLRVRTLPMRRRD